MYTQLFKILCLCNENYLVPLYIAQLCAITVKKNTTILTKFEFFHINIT